VERIACAIKSFVVQRSPSIYGLKPVNVFKCVVGIVDVAYLLDPYANLALTDVSIPVSILHMVCYWAVIALVTHVLAIAAFSLKKDYM